MFGSIRRTVLAVGAAALALIAAIYAAFRKGKASQRQETALEAAERYAKTRKRMDDADETVPSDPAVLRDWLRERGQR